eukprot:731139-Pleurochrysis_carterae.AAC.1
MGVSWQVGEQIRALAAFWALSCKRQETTRRTCFRLSAKLQSFFIRHYITSKALSVQRVGPKKFGASLCNLALEADGTIFLIQGISPTVFVLLLGSNIDTNLSKLRLWKRYSCMLQSVRDGAERQYKFHTNLFVGNGTSRYHQLAL